MSITYPLTLPSGFDSLVIMAESRQGRNTNLYTGKEQVYEHAGERWKMIVTYARMELADARIMSAFLLSLKGGIGTFIAGDPYMGAEAAGPVGGTPLVKGAGQTDFELDTDGWTISQSPIIKAGSFIQIGTYNLHMVVKDANSNGSGEATLDIWPRIRTSPADNSAVVITAPKCLWRLEDSDVSWSVDKETLYDFSLTAVEAI